MARSESAHRVIATFLLVLGALSGNAERASGACAGATRVSLAGDRWHINGGVTCPGSASEGLLPNVRMVNAVFENRNDPGFDAEGNTDEFIAMIPDYVAHGIRAFTLNLQGGHPGWHLYTDFLNSNMAVINSAFEPDGSLKGSYMDRVARVIEACDRNGAVVILGLFYFGQDQYLQDEAAIRAGVVNAVRWIRNNGFTNVIVEIANEYPQPGTYDHPVLYGHSGQISLMQLARQTHPGLLVSTSTWYDAFSAGVAVECDYLLVHTDKSPQFDAEMAYFKSFRKPVVINEDPRIGSEGAQAVEDSVRNGVSFGYMHYTHNQFDPFLFYGAADDPVVYAKFRQLTTPANGNPPVGGQGFAEVDGIVSMEAEHFSRNYGYTVMTDDGGNSTRQGWSGDGWMRTTVGDGAQKIEYDVHFTNPGTYYLHLRAWADDHINNGYHAELDGQRISYPPGFGIHVAAIVQWGWYTCSQEVLDFPVTLTVTTPGWHVFSIHLREEDSQLDKIVIHDGRYGTAGTWLGSSFGPPETLHGGGPAPSDSDGDGLLDVWELQQFGDLSESADGDPDGDGLSNAQELNAGTHPVNWDTDQDGYSDGEEVARGSDPNNSKNVPVGPDPVYSLSANPDAVASGEMVTVTWTAPEGSSSYDWIAIYSAGAADDDPVGGVFEEGTNWIYAAGMTSADFMAPAAEGTYEFRYFLAGTDSWPMMATSNPVTVSGSDDGTGSGSGGSGSGGGGRGGSKGGACGLMGMEVLVALGSLLILRKKSA